MKKQNKKTSHKRHKGIPSSKCTTSAEARADYSTQKSEQRSIPSISKYLSFDVISQGLRKLLNKFNYKKIYLHLIKLPSIEMLNILHSINALSHSI